MHLIELGKGNYVCRASQYVGRPALRFRVDMNHGKQIGSVEFVEEPDMDSLPGDTFVTFASKASIVGLIDCLTCLSESVDDTDEEDDCCGCEGQSCSEPYEVPAHAKGSDDKGEYRLIVLESQPKNWSHLRVYQNGDTIVVNKDFTERPTTGAEDIGFLIFLASGRWNYPEQPVKSEYPKYVVDRHLWDDVAYIEQAGPQEWACVMKDGSVGEMWPGMSISQKTDLFGQFIERGVWHYVSESEAKSNLEK